MKKVSERRQALPHSHWNVISHSSEETEQIGFQIGKELQPGDFLALNGELGAGKTVLVRGVLRGLGIQDFEGSPTFILVQSYKHKVRKWDVLHLDAYRLGSDASEEWLQLGWEEWLDHKAIIIAEWADYLKEILPSDRLELRLEMPTPEHNDESPGGRMIHVHATGSRSRQLLEAVCRKPVGKG